MEETPLKRKIAKGVAKFVIGASTGSTVAAVLKNNLPEVDSNIKGLKFVIGVAVMSSMAADMAKNWTDEQMSDLFNAIDDFKANQPEEETPAE